MTIVSNSTVAHPITADLSPSVSVGATDFRDALVAALALLAHADGEMAGSERRRILALTRDNPWLSDVPRDEIVEELAIHEANFRLDPEVAQLLAREKLVRVAGQRRLSHMIVEACRAVLPADGIAHPSEYRALGEIRDLLGRVGPAAPPLPTRSVS